MMNLIQERLLELSDTVDLGNITYYRLSKILGIDHPFKVKFAMDQLLKKGLLRRSGSGSISKPAITDESELINIPYYGEVNCGVALAFADDRMQSYLRVSPKILDTSDIKELFALRATGDSMNNASIHKRAVNHGDYIIVRKVDISQIHNKDYVVSVIGGTANLKKFYRDNTHRRIVLYSESKTDYPPIFINQDDLQDISSYQVIGKAIEVIPGFRE